MMKTSLPKGINYTLMVIALGIALFVYLLADQWALSFIEQALYISFFISSALAFYLFSQVFPLAPGQRQKRRWFVAANIITALIFLSFSLFYQQQITSEDRILLDPIVTTARIYRIDPEGYRKNRNIYFTFDYLDEKFQGVQSDIDQTHRIGDSVQVIFSERNPEANQLID
jgi:hypothetical protein